MFSVNIKEIKITGTSEPIIANISLALEEGDIYCLIGPNGSGKSTLIKGILNLLDPFQFSVEGDSSFNGISLYNSSSSELSHLRKGEIKYIHQDPIGAFDPLKKLGYYFNLFYYDSVKLEYYLKTFGLPSIKNLKQLYPYELSGGMAQRLLISFSLAASPKFIFLDEPTSGTDTAVVNILIHELRALARKGAGVFIVTHDLLFAEKISNYISIISPPSLSPILPVSDFFTSEHFKSSAVFEAYKVTL
jgi:peptide/nickel transport system ATP-binding protein